jgi:alpha-N-arabinofuranosidase
MRPSTFARTLLFSLAGTLFTSSAWSEPLQLDVDTATVAPIKKTLYGVFFEDINFAADGGLYAELVKNRSFEFESPLMGWSQPGSDPYSMNVNSGIATVVHHANQTTNKNVIKVDVFNGANYRLVNEGFRGMGVKQGEQYALSLYAANPDKGIKSIIAELIDTDNKVIGSTTLSTTKADWTRYTGTIKAAKTDAKARLSLRFTGKGSVSLDVVSLFPKNTWDGKTQGFRKDLVQLLADMKPGFLRFPGGCIIEGRTLAERYQWKSTLGDAEQRPTLMSRWNSAFSHKLTPDYFQTFGIGFYEYFQLAEDLGAEPIPVLSCGIACQFNSGEVAPIEDMQSYIQDAMDLIEFANGSPDTPWGKVRTEMGHKAPFNLKYIGIGNEQWGPQYIERYKLFHDAIKAKYPHIEIISSSGPFSDGEHFDYAHRELKKLNSDIVDEHYYKSAEWFETNAARYDSYDRQGPKIFLGEYAAQSVAIVSPDNKNTWKTALAEAAFMTGLERNADVVNMTSYAPIMGHVEAWQWSPNLIWFDNLRAVKTANYEVQKLFATQSGSDLLRITHNGEPLTGQQQLYASAIKDAATNTLIVKVANTSDVAKDIAFALPNRAHKKPLTLITLQGPSPDAENTLDAPNTIVPQTRSMSLKEGDVNVTIPHSAFVVVRIPLTK